MAPLLAYWNVRGVAQPIRLLLEYVGADYEEKLYELGGAPDYDKGVWLKEKWNLGLQFPNLPYYIDGDDKITESSAILRHLARKYKLDGATEQEKYRIDMAEFKLHDFKWKFFFMCYGFGIKNYDYEGEKKKFLEAIPADLKLFETFIGSNKWFAGDNITFIDFIAYEVFEGLLRLDETCLDVFPALKQFHERFAKLEKIAAYLRSPKCIVRAITNKNAYLCNK